MTDPDPGPREVADVYPPDARAELIRWALGHPFVERHRQQLVLEDIDRLLGVTPSPGVPTPTPVPSP